MKLVSVEQMRAIEKAANAAGHSYATMMELAGSAVAQAITQRVEPSGLRCLALVGPGNNGGDGLVAARVLRKAGAQVACYLFRPRGGDDANFLAAQDAGCFIAALPDDAQLGTLRNLAQDTDVIVDALLGTGTARPLEGDMAALLRLIAAEVHKRRERRPPALSGLAMPAAANAKAPLLVGIDGPTGMNYDTGEVDPLTLQLDLSVTFAYPKLGHLRFPAASLCGELLVADIGTDPKLASKAAPQVADAAMIGALLPARPLDAHKGTFGKVMIVAGSVYYSGAAVLAAQAAYRAGSGLVTLALPKAIYQSVAARMSETTYLILPDDMGVITPDAIRLVADKATNYQAMLLGPGLSSEKEAVEFVHRLFGVELPSRKRIGFQANADREFDPPDRSSLPPLVVDADGLNALAQVEQWWLHLPPQTILTPHPGEMARLIKLEGKDKKQLEAKRWNVAQRQASEWGHIVILKGAFTVIASPEGKLVVLPFANPALATAGSGDVLAGAVVGLLGQGLAPFEAAVCGAYLHGLAGELARQAIGPAGVLASDVLMRLPQAIQRVRAA